MPRGAADDKRDLATNFFPSLTPVSPSALPAAHLGLVNLMNHRAAAAALREPAASC
jgi:hypothetical protein